MALTELTLVFLGSLATVLSGAGLFGPFTDDATNVIMSFAGALLWGAFSISSNDVVVHAGADGLVSEPMLPLVYLGLGFSIIVGLFTMLQLLRVVQDETESTTEESIMP